LYKLYLKMNKSNIILVGCMGAGKTAVGRLVAGRLNLGFLDTDGLIERKAGKTISAIFAGDGEESFRRLEYELVKKLAPTQNSVIATGGGMVVDPANLRRLKELGQMVYLKTSPGELYRRIRNDNARPLLHSADPDQQLKCLEGLLESREIFYAQADYLVDTSDKTVLETAQAIINWWENRQNAGKS
jgi:shikimate kinase